ncbi:terminase small subunit [Pseudomonas aeruginosa]|uniref:terminase small subunit n=1 Tax=Pseudomonas aeruginosa TaxID=287 RepID=UPI0021E93D43|nr:terminase small subunit [Pseudomonas aeruginosa]MCV3804656.1 terminase small subunit [Pseudomonas aeruginosa]MCV3846553.1 terminase small subunit [Pseudomonas aeruginosa]MCV3864694.1 terminase small subunit [Pseudomonas aeruginosa]MCV3984203.1 terminase small subunit [Pseudomonas aeruginosa]MCV3990263.1 terminase small subunit [Pseudomonas aeruginosa]
MGRTISKKDLADLLGKSERWVSKLIEEGLPTQGGGGRGVAVQIDSQAAIEWLILREVRREIGDEGDDEEGLSSASAEDRLLKRARREKLQLEIDQVRGRLIPNEVFVALITSIAAIYATQLDALPSRCAADLAIIDDPALIRDRLFKETRTVRAATADRLERRAHELTSSLDQVDLGSGEAGQGTASEDE